MFSELRKKLIKVERTINIYEKDNTLIREIPIELPVDAIKEIIPQKEDDPNYYDGYNLTTQQIELISEFLKEKFDYNTENYNYYLVAGGIYNW